MSSGGLLTAEGARAAVGEQDVLAAAHLVSNRVLRRALAVAACERARIEGIGVENAVVLMICWVTRASDEIEAERAAGVRP